MTQDKHAKNNAKEALTDYFDDLLGSLAGSPLPEHDDQPLPQTSQADVSSKQAQKSNSKTVLQTSTHPPNDKVADKGSAERSAARADGSVSESKSGQQVVDAAQAARSARAAVYAEPVSTTLPKLAPPKIKTAPLAATETIVKPEVSNKTAEVSAPSEQSVPDAVAQETELAGAEDNVSLDNGLVHKPAEWPENGRPEWAQNRFECLLFSVAGLKLAVPLVSLGSIHRIEADFTPLVGRADWFLGLYRTGDRNIQAVNTAKWVMPRQYQEAVIEGYQFLIRLGDTNWGMACDSVAEAIQLDPDQVKWRTERSKRAWLSGTVIDHMCALLDAEMLSYLLQEDAKLRR